MPGQEQKPLGIARPPAFQSRQGPLLHPDETFAAWRAEMREIPTAQGVLTGKGPLHLRGRQPFPGSQTDFAQIRVRMHKQGPPGSGGKDSGYASHLLKYKYNMHPLTVTWPPLLYTDYGWQNFRNWLEIGGFDNLTYKPNGRVQKLLTRLAIVATTFIGAVSSVDVVWNFGSAAVGAMAWFNIIVIVLLTKPGIATLRDYEEQKKMGLDPVFIPSRCGIEGAEIWEGIAAKTYPDQLAALKAKTKVK